MRLAKPRRQTGKILEPGRRPARKRLILALVLAATALAAVWFFAAAPALIGESGPSGSAETTSAETGCTEDDSADSGATKSGGGGGDSAEGGWSMSLMGGP